MPYDIAWLYHKKVNEEIQKQIDNTNSVLSHLSSCREALEDNKRFPYLDRELIDQLKEVIKSIAEACQKNSDCLSENLEYAELKNSIQSLFEGKIGEEYNEGCLKKIYDEGSLRYKRCEPPGYESEETQENRIRYHDLIVWKQILAYAWNDENRCRGILYVTGKVRPDWYYIANGKIISTRHELINEFLKGMRESNADNFFYCLSSKQFVDIIDSQQTSQLDHLRNALGEEIVHASVNANGIANNQTNIQRIMNKNPFSFYDFLGYLFPGIIFLTLLVFAVALAKKMAHRRVFSHQQVCKCIPRDTRSEMVGNHYHHNHIVLCIRASCCLSFFYIVEYLANTLFKYPSHYLLHKEPVGFRSIFRRYFMFSISLKVLKSLPKIFKKGSRNKRVCCSKINSGLFLYRALILLILLPVFFPLVFLGPF